MGKQWNLSLEGFQRGFYHSTARFANMTSAWGSGKTLLAINKGVRLSGLYGGNLGLVLRRSFVNLKNSTMKDFTAYTGLSIKVQDKSVRFRNGSEIIFQHADELTSEMIQNINLGWWYIEQAEEFESDEVFNLLGGRLRRVLTPSVEVQKRLVGLGKLSRVVDDFNELGYEERLIAESAIIVALGEPLRQGLVIANARGHNWNWRKFINIGGDECLIGKRFIVRSSQTGVKYDYGDYASITQADTFENERNLPADYVAYCRELETSAPSTYRRLVLNSHEDSDIANQCISYQKLRDAVDRDLRDYDTDLLVVSCDPAEFGDDKTVIYVLKGLGVKDCQILSKREPMETAGYILSMYREYNADLIALDDLMVGSGIASRLRELLKDTLAEPVYTIRVSKRAQDSVKYHRLRDQLWMHAAELFRNDYVSIPNDQLLIEELGAFTYDLNSKGQVLVSRKKDVKKLLNRSPDRADALIMGLWAAKKGKKRLAFSGQRQDNAQYDVLRFGLD